MIQIHPQDFEKRSAQAIEDNINAKYADKVIHKVGLCVGLYDILTTTEGLIGHGTGIVNVNVDFRLIVFRPFKGEILQGKITSNHVNGIRITMDFFDDVFVPAPHMLFDPAVFDQAEQTWVWQAGEGNDLFFDNYEPVRFRVEGEVWTDLSPDKQMLQAEQAEGGGEGEGEARISPYEIQASMQQGGLGPLLWWDDEDDPAEEEDGYGEEVEQTNGGDETMEGME